MIVDCFCITIMIEIYTSSLKARQIRINLTKSMSILNAEKAIRCNISDNAIDYTFLALLVDGTRQSQ
jgi:hypothetical protein